MKYSVPIFSFLILIVWSAVLPPANAQVNVTQEHNNLSRDGVYIDPAFTPGNAANLSRDLNFNGTISGNVYAQPLYVEGGPNGPMIIAVTESNNVYALNATTGTVIWQRTDIGLPVTSGLPCGNINPAGITGTPFVDLTSRSVFFDALIDGPTKKHFIFSLNVDTGATNWSVDVNATATYNGTPFTSLVQEERGGLALVNGIVYVSYSGYDGDCGTYHGWVVGVDINNPSNVGAWATTAIGGGIWGHGGVASDGANMFVVTGNTFTTQQEPWSGGEAIVRLQAGPIFTGNPTDYWAPVNWHDLDNGDIDLGGVSATLVDVPRATPSQLVLALGKDGNAYLINRNNLGGIVAPVAQANVSGVVNRGTSAVTYHTNQGTYFAFHNDGSAVSAYKVTATNPPMIVSAWSVGQSGRGSPWVTTTDGTSNFIVWVAGVDGDQRLHGYDADTGAVIYAGGGANEVMSGTRQWNTGMVARGRIYFGADNKIYAFTVPTGTPTPTPTPTPTVQVTVQTSPAGLAFSVDGTTYTSTQTFSWVSGSSHTIATTSPQNGGTGVRYVWMNWSGGGAISHTVAPTTNKTYTANFRTQYHLTMTHGTGGRVSPASGWKSSGAAVSISATPANGYHFTNWTGNGTGSYSGPDNPASITMGGPITETATFTHN